MTLKYNNRLPANYRSSFYQCALAVSRYIISIQICMSWQIGICQNPADYYFTTFHHHPSILPLFYLSPFLHFVSKPLFDQEYSSGKDYYYHPTTSEPHAYPGKTPLKQIKSAVFQFIWSHCIDNELICLLLMASEEVII